MPRRRLALRFKPRWLAGLLLLAAAAHASELGEVKRRFVAEQTGEGLDGSAPAVADLCAAARALADALQPDGRWLDLSYSSPPAGPDWPIGAHYGRIHRLARAWRSNLCPGLSAELAVARKLETALAAGQPHYCGSCAKPGNWWWWNIGVPLNLAPALVLLEGAVDAQVFAAALDSLDVNVTAQRELSGANLADHAMHTLLLAVLRADPARAVAATRELESTCVITPHGLPFVEDDGIKSDFSFHQHQGQLSTGAYGQVFVDDVARYVTLTDGTAFALSEAHLATFGEALWFGTSWSLYGDDFDDNVIGRGVSREGNHAGGALSALVRFALRPSARQAQHLAAAKAFVSAWRHGYSLELAPLVPRVLAAPGAAGWPSGHRHYPDSDFTVHRRADWYASVRMLSTRMLSGENTNQEGKKAARQSDGRLVLLLEGDEYQGDVRPTLDQARLPGITVELSPTAASALYGAGARSFVGGAGDGVNGVSAMDFAPAAASGSKLTAKKSWFFFDDAIVFLTSAVDCPSSDPVQTIVEQWPLAALDAPLVADGVAQPPDAGWTAALDATWLAADGLGYWFPGGARVHLSRLVQRGRWSDLGTGRDTLLEHPVLTVWLDHGVAPDGGSAAYALVPRVDASAMAAWAAAAPLEVLSNTPQLAAVQDRRTGDLGVVFWRPGALREVRAHAPLVAWVRGDGGVLHLEVAEPTQLRQSVALTLAGDWALEAGDAGLSASEEGTRVQLGVETGKTVSVTLRRSPAPAPPPPSGCGCGGASGVATGLVLVLARRRGQHRTPRAAPARLRGVSAPCAPAAPRTS